MLAPEGKTPVRNRYSIGIRFEGALDNSWKQSIKNFVIVDTPTGCGIEEHPHKESGCYSIYESSLGLEAEAFYKDSPKQLEKLLAREERVFVEAFRNYDDAVVFLYGAYEDTTFQNLSKYYGDSLEPM